MKNKNLLYVIANVILIYILIFKIILTKNTYTRIIDIAFWVIISIITYILFRLPKSKSYIKKSTNRLIIISLLSLFVIVNLLGILIGFGKNPLNTSFIGIIKNIYSEIIIIVLQEYIRYIFCKNSQEDLKPAIFITTIYIILNIIMQINSYNLHTTEGIFCFVCAAVILTIAEQSLYTYMTYQVSISTTILFRLPFNLYTYIVPIIPALGEYLLSTINLIYFYLIYNTISINMEKYDKKKARLPRVAKTVFITPIILFLLFIIVLISGVLGYQLVTIGSNSMLNEYGRGDAVIYKKIALEEQNELEEGSILVFRKNDLVVTHRIIDITEHNNERIYKTKGDNNEKADNFVVNEDEVLGYVIYKVPYIGYPTILLNELFEKEK
ncbi:MAG: signal peptidase I [Bacilli bacterium]|nr:signal peptidase I [Bacilli bacterium]